MKPIAKTSPVQPHELSKPMRRGLTTLVGEIATAAAMQGRGQDLLLRIYLAGIYHAVELSPRLPPDRVEAGPIAPVIDAGALAAGLQAHTRREIERLKS